MKSQRAIKKNEYVQILMTWPMATVLRSAEHPNSYMTSMDIKLHYIALRRLGYFYKGDQS